MSAEQLYPPNQQPNSTNAPTDPNYQRVRARPPRRGGIIALAILAFIFGLVILTVGGGLFYLDRSYAGKIYPNITIQGLAIGEMTPQQAEVVLRARYGTFLDHPTTITYNGKTWEPTLGELGMQFDFAGAINQAYQAGRGHGMYDNVREVAAIWQNGLDLPLRISYDEQQTQQYVITLAQTIDRAPIDAALQLDGTRVATAPAQIGYQLLVNQAVGELSAGLQSFQPTTVQLNVRELTPRLLDAPVQAAAMQVESILSAPIELTLSKNSYAWELSDIAKLIAITRTVADGGDTIAVQIDGHAIERQISQIANTTEIPGTRPRVAWNNGNLKITKPGDNGWRVDEGRAREMIVNALQGGPRAIELPMRETMPPVNETNLNQLGITDLVSVGKSDFTGSAGYRVHNIGIGMNILNGILIAPGEEFSFNKNIGEIDGKNGFVEGSAIVQNRTQQEFGGGICQDSTTIFRAAFWAGLPVTERWGHSFYISWYDKYGLGSFGNGPGLDATIFTGGPDLKFLNDTGAWLLLQTWSDSKSGVAQVELYGPKLNRRVELTQRVYNRLPAPPNPVFVTDATQPAGHVKQSDKSRGGMTIDVVRTVYIDGVATDPDLFRTTFRAWPNIFVVNPADMGPDGRPIVGWGNQPAPTLPPPTDPSLPPPTDPSLPPPTDPTLPPIEPAPVPATGTESPPNG
jgi:vancomycin resistance protein YoaR